MLADVASVGLDGIVLLSTLIVAGASLIYAVRSGHTQTMASIEDAMSKRIDDLVRQLDSAREQNAECARRCARLESENYKLARRVAGLENGDH